MKRFLSLLLAMLMVAGALSIVSLAEEEYDELPEDATLLDYAGYVHDAYFVILAGDFLTVAELTELGIGEQKDMNWFVVAVVDEHDCITEIHTTLGRPDGIKSDVVCPEGGYLIGLNGAKEGYQVLLTAQPGDYVDLFNIDVDSFRDQEGSIALTNAGFTISRIGETPEESEESEDEPATDTSSEVEASDDVNANESAEEEESTPAEESETVSAEESKEATEEATSTDTSVEDESTAENTNTDSQSETTSDDDGSVLIWVIVIGVVVVAAVVVLVLVKKKK